MPSLACNLLISAQLRTKYQWGLAILPIGLMFASFLPSFVFGRYLSEVVFGIPESAALKSHPNGILCLVLVLGFFLSLMILGYFLGWFLNAFIFRSFYGWDREKIREVFQESKVPNEWLRSSVGQKPAMSGNWANIRKMGKGRFILTHGVFGWGLVMFVLMTIFPALNSSGKATFQGVLLGGFIWTIAGAFFGWSMWYISEKQFQAQVNELNISKGEEMSEPNKREQSKPKFSDLFKDLKWYEVVGACWPIFLMFVGGAIGGASGGFACSLNLKIFRSNLSGPLKYIYSFLIGLGGILLYVLVITILSVIFPNLFKNKA